MKKFLIGLFLGLSVLAAAAQTIGPQVIQLPLSQSQGGAGTITGALKGSGAGVVSQAACADLSNGSLWCQANSGAWTAYTPTLACGIGNFTSATAVGRYVNIGKTTLISVVITITTNGTCASFASFTLPFTTFGSTAFSGRSSGGSSVAGQTVGSSAVVSYAGATGVYVGADGQTVVFNGVFENQ